MFEKQNVRLYLLPAVQMTGCLLVYSFFHVQTVAHLLIYIKFKFFVTLEIQLHRQRSGIFRMQRVRRPKNNKRLS